MQAGSTGKGADGGMHRQGEAACVEFKATKAQGMGPSGTAGPAAAGGRAAADAQAGSTADADGFQTVQRRGWRKARGSQHVVEDGGDGGGTGDARGGHGDVVGGSDQVVEVEEADEGGEAPPTPNTLHRAWQNEVAMVRCLRKQGVAHEHPAMQAACAARDSAERSWRDAKDPAPAAVRLARAQAKLDRAIELQAEGRNALAEYEEVHRRELATLHDRIKEDGARVRLRRQQLEAIQAEVGAGGLGARARGEQCEAVRRVHSSLCGTVAPTISALIEQLDSSTPAWSVLNGLLGTLSESKAALESAFSATPGAQRYDIADGAGAEDEDEVWREDWDGGSQWSESHDLAACETGGRGSAWGRSGEAAADPLAATPSGTAGVGKAMDEDQCMGTEDWWDKAASRSWGPAARWQECSHGKWARASWAESWEQEQEGQDYAAEQPAAARRRLEDAPAAPAGNGGAAAADERAAIEERKRQHERRVQDIISAAIDAGIQPLSSDGEELHLLEPHKLDEWMAANFPAGLPTR